MWDPTAILILLLTIITATCFFFFSSPKSKTPSPGSYPIIGNLPGLLLNFHRFHSWVTELLSSTPSSTIQVTSFLHISHGIATANPANVSHILSSNFSNYVKGSRSSTHLEDLLGFGIFNSDGQLWSTQRKIASHVFSTKSLKLFISQVVNSQISNSLIPYFSKASQTGVIFDLQDFLQDFTFNNICQVAFGVDPTTWGVSTQGGFFKCFDDAVEISFSRLVSPIPVWKLRRFLNVGSEKRLREAIERIDEFAYKVIKTKEEGFLHDKKEDLLSRFVLMSSGMEFKNNEEKRKFLRDIVISFVLAGKDSTSTALTWFFWLLAGNPRCKERICDELDSLDVLLEQSISTGYDDLKRLDYLHATLSESMRLFPPVPINSRSAVNDDVLPDGTRVKRGWFADYSAYAMGRMESLWGPDCREFKPERWLDGMGVCKSCDLFKYPVFHCGPRTCLGKDMAYIQMKAIVAAVMREFDVVPVDGGSTEAKMVDPPYVLSALLKMKGGLPVRVRRRETCTGHLG